MFRHFLLLHQKFISQKKVFKYEKHKFYIKEKQLRHSI